MPKTQKPNKRENNETEERHKVPEELLDQILESYESRGDMFGEGGLLEGLKQQLVQRALEGELTHHLGYGKHEHRPPGQQNVRNPRSVNGGLMQSR